MQEKEDMEHVSVIIPTYNREGSILRSVESVLAQTYPDFELWIIDDGSTDETGRVVLSIADDRIRYHKCPQNRGVAAARNEGIRLAQYDYVAFQDSDDFWRADKLEKQMRVFEEKPECGLVYCAFEGTKSDGSKVVIPPPSMSREDKQGRIYGQLLQANVIDAPTAVIRKACLAKVGGFDTSLQCLEDWELFLRIAKEYEIGFVEEALLLSDLHNTGVSSHVGGYFHARCTMIARHREALLKYGIFDRVVEQVLLLAKQAGVLEQAARLLEQCLRE